MFIILATAGGELICSPMVCFAESHEEAQALAAGELAGMFKDLPGGTILHSFDTDCDVKYIGEPPKEEQPDAPEESEAGGSCDCPMGIECDQYNIETGGCGLVEALLPDAAGPAKQCAGPSKAARNDGDGEGRVYRPGELLFAIGPYDHPGQEEVPEDERVRFTLHLTTRECWEKEGCQSDDLGGYNVDGAALDAAGICRSEIMESVFEVNPVEGDTRQAVAARLIEAGFGYVQAFQFFIDKCRKGGA